MNAFACGRPPILSWLARWAEKHGLAARWIDGHPDQHPEDHPGVLLIEGPDAYELLAERADPEVTLYPDGDPDSLPPGELLREAYFAGSASPFS